MNKDAVLATLIGFAIGLTITGIIIVAPSVAKNAPKVSLPSLPRISLPSLPKFQAKKTDAKITPAVTQTVKGVSAGKDTGVDTPAADAVLSEDTTTVTGRAPAKSRVLVQSPVEDAATTVTDSGAYSVKVSLKEGKNDILITVSDESGVIQERSVTVYYTPESL